MERFSGSISAWTDGRDILGDQGFDIRWGHISTKELTADMYRGGEVGSVEKLSVFLTNDDGLCNQFGKVVHGKTSKDFLENELHLFGMEEREADGVFHITERSLNAPA